MSVSQSFSLLVSKSGATSIFWHTFPFSAPVSQWMTFALITNNKLCTWPTYSTVFVTFIRPVLQKFIIVIRGKQSMLDDIGLIITWSFIIVRAKMSQQLWQLSIIDHIPFKSRNMSGFTWTELPETWFNWFWPELNLTAILWWSDQIWPDTCKA